jgi:hypothetical protein
MYPNFLNCRNFKTIEKTTAAMVMMIISGHPHMNPMYALSTFIKASIDSSFFFDIHIRKQYTPTEKNPAAVTARCPIQMVYLGM